MYLLYQQTSPKHWFENMTMTSNCDVTNSAHEIEMTTISHWMKSPLMKIFCVRHWPAAVPEHNVFCYSAVAHILTPSVNLAFGPKSGFKNKCRVRPGFGLVISGSGRVQASKW